MQPVTPAFSWFNNLTRHGHLRQVGSPILFAAVAMFISAVMLLGVNISNLHQSFMENARTNDTILQIVTAEAKLVGVEMTVRGFALTGDPAFLDRQKSERKDLKVVLERLGGLVAGDPEQRKHFAEARKLIQMRLDLFAYLSAPGHVREVPHAITDPKTRAVMGQAHYKLRDLLVAEREHLRQKQAEINRQAAEELGWQVVLKA